MRIEDSPTPDGLSAAPAFLSGDGEMATRMRGFDWSQTDLGAPATWPQSLQSVLSICLNSPIVSAIYWGPDFRVLYNDAYGPALGTRHPQALGRPLREVWPEIFDILGPQLQQVVTSGQGFSVDRQPLTMLRYGVPEETVWFYVFAPVRGENGDVAGVFVTATEMTKQITAEAALRHLNATLEQRVATIATERDQFWRLARDPFLISDAQGRWLSASPIWTEILGWTQEELLGRTSAWMEHPDDHDKTRDKVVDIAAGEVTLTFVNRFRDTQGRYHTFSWTAVAEDNLLYCVARDITEQRAQELELRDAQDFSRLALSAVGGVGVWTYEVGPDRFHYDAEIAKLYGLDPALGSEGLSREDFLANVLPEDRAELKQTMDGGLVSSGDLELEYRTRDANGAVRWVLSRGHTYFDDHGRPVRRTGVGVEVTRQRELEAQFRQAQKMEAVGQLTGGVAHDFNNLLTIIKSSIDFLQRPGLSDERRERYTGAISDTVDRASKLTSQLLAFARRQPLNPEVFDVGEKVVAIAELVRTLLGARILVTLDLPGTPTYAKADVGQFETALVNLAVNARDAMEGEGRLSIQVAAVDAVPQIRTQPPKPGSYVAVTVQDQGSGIGPDKLEAIFEPFFTTKEVGKGTGLGLSQVFGFAKQSRGEVSVESTLGEGSAFTVYLPRIVDAPPVIRSGPSSLSDAAVEDVCVLVVEDNETVGQFSTELLHDLGYKTKWAANAHEALDALGFDATGFDLVFSDVVMPGMNGIEFARTVRKRFPGLPIVLTSGYSEVLATEGHEGFQLIQKPYSVEALSRILKSALGRFNIKDGIGG